MKLLYCERVSDGYAQINFWNPDFIVYRCYYEDGETKDFSYADYLIEVYNHLIQGLGKVESIEEELESLKGDYTTDVAWNFKSSSTCGASEEESYSGAGSGFKAIFDLLFFIIEQYERLRGIMCNQEVCVAMPEHYQIPMEAHRPQLVLQFAKPKEDEPELQSANHVISIPHYNGTIDDPAPVTFYDKGNYRGKLTLKDNSKVHVYGNSQSECFRMIKAIRLWINPAMLEGATEKYDQFPSADIENVRVYPKYAKYWPTGAKEDNPAWTVRYAYNPE